MTLMTGALQGAGWTPVPAADAYGFRRTGGRWPAGWPQPRVVVRPVGGIPWWHWAAPTPIAGVPIAPLRNGDRALQLLRGTLAKLAARADVDGIAAP